MDIRGTCGILYFYYERYFFFPFPYLVLIIYLVNLKPDLIIFLIIEILTYQSWNLCQTPNLKTAWVAL